MRILELFVTSMLVTGCSSVASPVRPVVPQTTTGVFVNGEELAAADKRALEQRLHVTLPPGRYYVDAAGRMGLEGEHPTIDLVSLGVIQRGPIVDAWPQDPDGCTIITAGADTFTTGDC